MFCTLWFSENKSVFKKKSQSFMNEVINQSIKFIWLWKRGHLLLKLTFMRIVSWGANIEKLISIYTLSEKCKKTVTILKKHSCKKIVIVKIVSKDFYENK